MNNMFNIIWLDSVDSTNNEALRRISDIDNMSVIAATSQTAGRGQRGNTWESESGSNLTFTAVVKFGGDKNIRITDQFILTRAATCAVTDYLKAKGIKASVKWPNDIWAGDRKICGMLIENTLQGANLAASVIGIGINLNQKQFSGGLTNPVSLSMLTGQKYDVHAELDAVLDCLNDRLTQMFTAPDELEKDYLGRMYRRGVAHEYRDLRTGNLFIGKILGTEPDGRLIMEMPDGSQASFAFKEVGYII